MEIYNCYWKTGWEGEWIVQLFIFNVSCVTETEAFEKKLHLKSIIFKELVCHYFYTSILCCMTDLIFPWELAIFWGCCDKHCSEHGTKLKNCASCVSPVQEHSVKLGRRRGTKRKRCNGPTAHPFPNTAQHVSAVKWTQM